jgi:hypothetical protein
MDGCASGLVVLVFSPALIGDHDGTNMAASRKRLMGRNQTAASNLEVAAGG